MTKYKITLTFTEPLLASSPADPEVYARFIAERKKKQAEETGQGDTAEEVGTIENRELGGWSVFHKDDSGLFLFDYKIRGFIKEAATAVTGKAVMSGFKSKIDRWLFVSPRRLYLWGSANGLPLASPAGVFERPIRAMTAQGPRVSLKRSDYVSEGTHITAILSVLPLGEKEITEKVLRCWLDYGQLLGMGERRTDGYGRFTYTLEAVAEHSAA